MPEKASILCTDKKESFSGRVRGHDRAQGVSNATVPSPYCAVVTNTDKDTRWKQKRIKK